MRSRPMRYGLYLAAIAVGVLVISRHMRDAEGLLVGALVFAVGWVALYRLMRLA